MPDLWLPGGPDPFTTHRVESWWVDLLDEHDTPVGRLDGVTGGTIEQNVNRIITGGGTLDVVDRGQDIPWLSARVQPWWHVHGADPWPLGVYLCSAPVATHTDAGVSWRVELLDKLLVLDEDKIEAAYAVPAGAVVTDTVQAVIASTGEAATAVTDSTETLTSGMVWPPGTSKLRIVNDLLDAINYFSVRVDGHGTFVAAPYQAPAQRPTVRQFVPGPAAIHTPDFTRDQDLAGIPNRVVLVSAGGRDEESLVGVASNTDPASPTSHPSRGRWVVHAEEGVEATSQAVIDGLARRRLVELSTVAATVEIDHAAVPLAVNDVVAFDTGTGSPVRAATQSWSLALAAGSLMRTRVREVTA